VRSLLAATGGREEELDCGLQDGRPPEPVFHNCSGKHAGMLAVCRAHGWPIDGYRQPSHPLQQLPLEEVAAAAELPAHEVATGGDGCGVVCFAISLECAALAFSRLEQLDGGGRVAAAMRAFPQLIGGEGATDTELMRSQPGWLAKAGAEGLMCAASADGVGVAVKVVDGNARALRPALAAFGRGLGLALPAFEAVPLTNAHAEAVAASALL
jgi:L-asparaginase II